MNSETPSRPESRRRRPPAWSWLLIVGVLGLALIAGLVVCGPAARDLSYGQFKAELMAGRIRSAWVSPTEVSGELRPEAPGTAPVAFRASRVGLERDDHLIELLERHVAEGNYGSRAEQIAPLAVLGPVALAAALLGGLWFLSKKGGFGSAMAFAKSKHRLFDRNECQVTFDDVAGIDEAVEELREGTAFLQTPEKYRALGGRLPQGILLVGPPGTGKTLLAKAVAGEAGVPFFSLSGSDFVEMFVGVGAARVRSLFAEAEAHAPCLIFIDELDALGKARSSGGPGQNDERDQTLNQLLVQMDGFDANRGIILIAATNRPETLDAALVRPGRFDRQVVVDRPDITGREHILRVHSRTIPLDDEINLRHIAAMTSGFVGADLANLVNEAALLAARKGKDKVGAIEFQEGVERVIAGPEKKQRVLRADERQRIAYHEAGHALVAPSLPGTDPVHKVSILGRGNGALGYTMYRPEDDRFLHTQSWLEHTICSLLGGTIAEEIIYGEVSDGCTSDLQRATQIARKMVTEFGMSPRLGRVSFQNEGRSPFLPGGGAGGDSWSEQTAREIDLEVRAILDRSQAATLAILTDRRAALEEVTQSLLDRESIDSADLQAIVDRHPLPARA